MVTQSTTSGIQTPEALDSFFSVSDPWGYDSHPDDRKRVEHILSTLPSDRPNRVLDIGCGNGFLTVQLPGREILGVDFSQEAVGWARQRAHRLGRSEVSFRVASVFDLDMLPASHFDLVVVTGVLYRQYIGQAFTSVAASIMRRMTPSGHLVHAHIESWFNRAFPLNRVAARTYPYRDHIHLLEVYKN